jgi:hypothetical protein
MSGGGVRLDEPDMPRCVFVAGDMIALRTISGDGVRLWCCILAAGGSDSRYSPHDLKKDEEAFPARSAQFCMRVRVFGIVMMEVYAG